MDILKNLSPRDLALAAGFGTAAAFAGPAVAFADRTAPVPAQVPAAVDVQYASESVGCGGTFNKKGYNPNHYIAALTWGDGHSTVFDYGKVTNQCGVLPLTSVPTPQTLDQANREWVRDEDTYTITTSDTLCGNDIPGAVFPVTDKVRVANFVNANGEGASRTDTILSNAPDCPSRPVRLVLLHDGSTITVDQARAVLSGTKVYDRTTLEPVDTSKLSDDQVINLYTGIFDSNTH
jgi:hypothetical protein